MHNNENQGAFGVEIVKFDYSSLPSELSALNWEEKFSHREFDAAEVINNFSSYFFKSCSQKKSVQMQLLVLTERGCMQLSPTSLENHMEKQAFSQVVPEIIQNICEEDDDSPIMMMLCCEAWTCAVSKSLAEKIDKSYSNKKDAEHLKSKLVEDVVNQWGGISAVPNNHSQIVRFDGFVHISFFNDSKGPVSVMRKHPCDEKILHKIDPFFANHFAKPMVARGDDMQGNMSMSTEGFNVIPFDESMLK